MPFRSEAQSRAAFGGYLGPKMRASAKEWASKTNYSHLPKYAKTKKKLGLKGKTKPGDLLDAYKKQVVSKGKWYAETDTHKKVIKVNKKMHKTHPLHKKQYPELKDTLIHETFHAKHPNWTEKKTYKETHKRVKTIGKKESHKLYNMFNK